ncbi:BTB/POZ protein [Rhizophagus irregularis DAOM 181602=DAOM 197198]|nr:BTB/POZ protein [Rhizophagus irregularis DAOM 181602=DAOM 197198]
MDDKKFLPKLSQNLLEILNDEEYYDVTIEVGNDPNKNDGTLSHIKLPNISPEIFQIILRYIYGGGVSLKEYDDASDIIKILIAAMKDSNEILGGYNPTEWKSDKSHSVTKDSFIFSFNNNDRIENHILSRVTNENRAIFNESLSGPKFSNDLIILGNYNGNVCRITCYEKSIRETTDQFIIEEFEVFQIV